MPRHRQGDRQFNGVAVRFVFLVRFLVLFSCLDRFANAVKSRCSQCLQHRLNLLAVGAVAEVQRAVLGYREVVDLVSCRRHALVLGLRAGCLRDDLHQRLALVPGYVVVNPHVRILLFFFPGFPWGSVYITLNRENSKRISRHLSEKSHITLRLVQPVRHLWRPLLPGPHRPASCHHVRHTPDPHSRNHPHTGEG